MPLLTRKSKKQHNKHSNRPTQTNVFSTTSKKTLLTLGAQATKQTKEETNKTTKTKTCELPKQKSEWNEYNKQYSKTQINTTVCYNLNTTANKSTPPPWGTVDGFTKSGWPKPMEKSKPTQMIQLWINQIE